MGFPYWQTHPHVRCPPFIPIHHKSQRNGGTHFLIYANYPPCPPSSGDGEGRAEASFLHCPNPLAPTSSFNKSTNHTWNHSRSLFNHHLGLCGVFDNKSAVILKKNYFDLRCFPVEASLDLVLKCSWLVDFIIVISQHWQRVAPPHRHSESFQLIPFIILKTYSYKQHFFSLTLDALRKPKSLKRKPGKGAVKSEWKCLNDSKK